MMGYFVVKGAKKQKGKKESRPTSRGLPINCDFLRIAAKSLNVVPDPEHV